MSQILSIEQQAAGEEPPWLVSVEMNGTPMTFEIDSGADVSVISKSKYQTLHDRPTLEANHTKLDSLSGRINTVGIFSAIFRHDSQNFAANVHVVVHPVYKLMSRFLTAKMNLISRVDNLSQAFSNSGKMNIPKPIGITLSDGIEPCSV